VFGSLGTPTRTRWLALLIFVAGNWVAQDYFAPQALAFVLAIAFVGIVLTWLHGREKPPALAVAAAVLVFSAIVVSHQLTPYILIVAVGILTALGRAKPRWLVALMLAEAVLYLLPRYDMVAGNFGGLFSSAFDIFNNARSNAAPPGGLAGRIATARAARILSFAIWGLAALGLLRRRRARVPSTVVVALAATPLFVVLAQSYGGEAVFRVYLFSLPWSALLAASLVHPSAPSARRSALGAVLLSCALLPLLIQAYFGSEAINRVWPSDVAAADYFYAHAPAGSALVLTTPDFPSRDSADYDRFKSGKGEFETNLASLAFRGVFFGPDTLASVEKAVRTDVGPNGHGFLALGPGQRAYAAEFELLPPGSIESLDRALAGSPRWRLFFRQGDSAIYELQGD
jgi:hypothetical protein